MFYSMQILSAFLIGIVRNINIAGFQSGKRIKGVVWERQEVGSSGFCPVLRQGKWPSKSGWKDVVQFSALLELCRCHCVHSLPVLLFLCKRKLSWFSPPQGTPSHTLGCE